MKNSSGKTKKHGSIQLRIISALLIMMSLLCIAVMAVSSSLYRSRMEKTYADYAFNIAASGAQLIDGDTIATYYETGVKDEYYRDVLSMLILLKEQNGLKYFYVVVPEEDHMVYIWDAGQPGAEGVCDLLDTDSYYGGGDELMHAAFNGTSQRQILITNNDEYGYLASAYVPILNSEGVPVALSSVDISMEDIDSSITHILNIIGAITIGLLVAGSVTFFIYLRQSIVKPVKELSVAASEFVSNTENRVSGTMSSLNIRSTDEIGDLYSAVCKMEKDMGDYLVNLKHVTAEKERLDTELNVATRIQADMLPSISPEFSGRNDFELAASMDPAKEVGGDFYDFFMLDEDHLAMVIADVSGKGVPAALVMVIAKTLIKNQAQFSSSPAEILAAVNDRLCESNTSQMFVTAWMGIMDIKTGLVKAANAGHEYPALQNAEGKFELLKDRHGLVLAAMEGSKYKEYEFTVPAGGALYVYTDGVPEATSVNDQLFGTDRMLDALNIAPEARPQQLIINVRYKLDEFVGDREQFDDITMLCVRRKAS